MQAREFRGVKRSSAKSWRPLWIFAPALLLAGCGGASGDTGSGGSSGGTSGGTTGGTASGTLVTVNGGERHQTISGWEATVFVDDYNGEISRADAVAYDQAAVDKAGLTRLRLEIRSGAEGQIGAYNTFSSGGGTDWATWRSKWYTPKNDDNDPNSVDNNPSLANDSSRFDWSEIDHVIDFVVEPVKAALTAKKEKLFIDLCYVSFNDGVSNVHDDPAEYAEFALATMLHLKQKGITPDNWEIILEPDKTTGPGGDGTGWSGKEIGDRIVATSALFKKHGFAATKFVGPSTLSMANAATWFDGIKSVNGAVPLMSELSYHRYGGVSASALNALKTRAEANALDLAMLEYWFGDADIDILFEDLAAGAVAFDGRAVKGLFKSGPPSPTLQDEMRYNSVVFKAVRPGAVRVSTTTASGPFKSLAFLRPNNGGTVVALRATSGGTATIRGLASGSYTVTTVTNSSQSGPSPVTQASNGDIVVSIGSAGLIVVQPG